MTTYAEVVAAPARRRRFGVLFEETSTEIIVSDIGKN